MNSSTRISYIRQVRKLAQIRPIKKNQKKPKNNMENQKSKIPAKLTPNHNNKSLPLFSYLLCFEPVEKQGRL